MVVRCRCACMERDPRTVLADEAGLAFRVYSDDASDVARWRPRRDAGVTVPTSRFAASRSRHRGNASSQRLYGSTGAPAGPDAGSRVHDARACSESRSSICLDGRAALYSPSLIH